MLRVLVLLLLLLLLNITEKAEWDERKRYKLPDDNSQSLGRWEHRVKEYVSERGVRGNGLEQARRECTDRERWRSFCRGHPMGDASGGSKASELLID